jgi:hypothetical protein
LGFTATPVFDSSVHGVVVQIASALRIAEHCRIGVDEREPHVGRLVLLVGVDAGLAELVARERRAAARAVGDDLEILVEQALIEKLAQMPPDGLDVGGAQRPVGRIRIEPVADPRGQPGNSST